jgi:hypothetical protein
MAHDILWQAAGMREVNRKGLAAFIDFNGLGVEGHLIGGVDSRTALCRQQMPTGQCQQGYSNKLANHG